MKIYQIFFHSLIVVLLFFVWSLSVSDKCLIGISFDLFRFLVVQIWRRCSGAVHEKRSHWAKLWRLLGWVSPVPELHKRLHVGLHQRVATGLVYRTETAFTSALRFRGIILKRFFFLQRIFFKKWAKSIFPGTWVSDWMRNGKRIFS